MAKKKNYSGAMSIGKKAAKMGMKAIPGKKRRKNSMFSKAMKMGKGKK